MQKSLYLGHILKSSLSFLFSKVYWQAPFTQQTFVVRPVCAMDCFKRRDPVVNMADGSLASRVYHPAHTWCPTGLLLVPNWAHGDMGEKGRGTASSPSIARSIKKPSKNCQTEHTYQNSGRQSKVYRWMVNQEKGHRNRKGFVLFSWTPCSVSLVAQGRSEIQQFVFLGWVHSPRGNRAGPVLTSVWVPCRPEASLRTLSGQRSSSMKDVPRK